MAAIIAFFVAVLRIFLIFRREPTASDVRANAAETTLNAVEKRNEMETDIGRMSGDAIRDELHRDWEVRPVEADTYKPG